MSGFAGELDRAAHLKTKISRVITKPFTLEQIRSAVKAALVVRIAAAHTLAPPNRRTCAAALARPLQECARLPVCS